MPTILLAEDNGVNQKLALRMLGRIGYQADAVADGHEVLAAFDRTAYDIVLMDIQMPELDGLETTRRLRALLPVAAQPQIIALTANVSSEDRHDCLAAGMNDYIGKPIELETLRAAIGRALERMQAQGGQS
jgi:CheY-like chemotaxis protein